MVVAGKVRVCVKEGRCGMCMVVQAKACVWWAKGAGTRNGAEEGCVHGVQEGRGMCVCEVWQHERESMSPKSPKREEKMKGVSKRGLGREREAGEKQSERSFAKPLQSQVKVQTKNVII